MTSTVTQISNGCRVELINLLDPKQNKIYGAHKFEPKKLLSDINLLKSVHGEFAIAELIKDVQGSSIFRGARTIGVPARVACQLISSNSIRIIVAHTIGEIADTWNNALQNHCSFFKPFDVTYTEMLPAFYGVSINLEQMQDRSYDWFLSGPEYKRYKNADLFKAEKTHIGIKLIDTLAQILQDQVEIIGEDAPIAVSLSGGLDSSVVTALLLDALQNMGRKNQVHAITLGIDNGGTDLEQAKTVYSLLKEKFGAQIIHHPITVSSDDLNINHLKQEASLLLEEYHVRDIECGAASLALSYGLYLARKNENIPECCVEFNGDGGNELFQDYQMEDDGYGAITLDDIQQNPLLYFLGYERKKLAFNPVFSSGLSRAYTRTFNPARKMGVTTFSPFIDRRAIDIGQRIPLSNLVNSSEQLYELRGEIMSAGIKHKLGIALPIFPKKRFQEGCAASSTLFSVSKEEAQQLKKDVMNCASMNIQMSIPLRRRNNR